MSQHRDYYFSFAPPAPNHTISQTRETGLKESDREWHRMPVWEDVSRTVVSNGFNYLWMFYITELWSTQAFPSSSYPFPGRGKEELCFKEHLEIMYTSAIDIPWIICFWSKGESECDITVRWHIMEWGNPSSGFCTAIEIHWWNSRTLLQK